MFCTKCGKQLEVGAKFCSHCGNKIDNSLSNFVKAGSNAVKSIEVQKIKDSAVSGMGSVGNAANSFTTKISQGESNRESNIMSNPTRTSKRNLKDLFIDSNEQQIAVLGGGYLDNFLATGLATRGFCVVSDRRVYFRGKCYHKTGKHYKSTSEERTVDLKDVTGTGFVESRYLSLLILGIAVALFTLFYFFLYCSWGGEEGFDVLVISALAAVAIFALYFFMKRKLFEISFAGGMIAFMSSSYNLEEMQNFQKSLRKAKDNYTPAPQYVVNNSAPMNNAVSSVTDELKKYKELLDTGVITQEEFDTKKKQLLSQ